MPAAVARRWIIAYALAWGSACRVSGRPLSRPIVRNSGPLGSSARPGQSNETSRVRAIPTESNVDLDGDDPFHHLLHILTALLQFLKFGVAGQRTQSILVSCVGSPVGVAHNEQPLADKRASKEPAEPPTRQWGALPEWAE
jgi:hypothetical protein